MVWPTSSGPKFVAVFHIPNVQLLLASASYGRPMDFDYYLFHKKYQDMYQELKSSPLAAEKFFVEDTLADAAAHRERASGACNARTTRNPAPISMYATDNHTVSVIARRPKRRAPATTPSSE